MGSSEAAREGTEDRSVSGIARQILEIIPGPRQWSKGSFSGGYGERHCLLGGWSIVLHGGIWSPSSLYRDTRSSPFLQVVAGIIREQFPERLESDAAAMNRDWWCIMKFNDNWRTRYADVRLVLEKAAAHE